eukprot:15470913-Alexandrium_andersonii.AAC.1
MLAPTSGRALSFPGLHPSHPGAACTAAWIARFPLMYGTSSIRGTPARMPPAPLEKGPGSLG